MFPEYKGSRTPRNEDAIGLESGNEWRCATGRGHQEWRTERQQLGKARALWGRRHRRSRRAEGEGLQTGPVRAALHAGQMLSSLSCHCTPWEVHSSMKPSALINGMAHSGMLTRSSMPTRAKA